MSDPANLRVFEDIEPGETHQSGPYKVTREQILAFARMYDPQPFHLDDAAAEASVLGGLAASGWHTTAIGMYLYFHGFVKHVAGMGAPGVDEVRWLRPVKPDDELTLHVSIPTTRPSASRPDRGFISVEIDMRNGGGETVMTQRFSMMVQRRGAAQDIRPPLAPHLLQAPALVETPPPDPKLCGFLDEAEIGAEFELGSQTFAPDAIIAFAESFDPQYFHTDPERAKQSHFGGLAASGWHTAALWMKSYIDARDRSAALRRSQGLQVAVPGPSPGFANMKWLRPVLAGETIGYQTKVTGVRRLTRPGWGLIESLNTGRAADGALVFSFEGRILWPFAPGR
ncbi:MAG: MaoC family dehydratase [Beijerinckiaceae bacterium]|nr:MaoC family dehydratase [Beijerinckiaceae bacterium]